MADEIERDRERMQAVYAWLRLVHVFSKVQHALSASLRCRALSPAQFDVLAQVGTHQGVVQQRLAESLLVTKGNVCQLLDRMEDAGVLERQADGRVNRIVLTDSGQALFGEVVPQVEELIAEQLSALTPEERAQLLALLRKLDQSLPSGAEEPKPRAKRPAKQASRG